MRKNPPILRTSYVNAPLSATNQPLRGVALPLPAIMLLLGTLDVDLLRGSFWSAVKGKELLFFGVYVQSLLPSLCCKRVICFDTWDHMYHTYCSGRSTFYIPANLSMIQTQV